MSEENPSTPVTRRECDLNHKYVAEQRKETREWLKSLDKKLNGIIILLVANMAGLITVLASK